MQNFRALGAPPPGPPCLRRLGALPPNPQPPAAGCFAPRPPLASGGWGLRPQNPKNSPHCEFLATRLREFTKLPTGLSFFVVVASAVARMRPGGAVPHERLLAPPPILVHSECFFGASRNDKTTGNNGKRNNNFQT